MKDPPHDKKASYVVFLSHSSKDRWIARQMANLILEHCGASSVEVFLDERAIEGGDSIPDVIRDTIERCSELVVLLSSSSVGRDWVLIEVSAAWQLKKRIVPIVDKVGSESIPEIIRQQKTVDLNDFDDYLAQLLRRAKEVKR